ncbi:hypothetical protein [Mastigocoleus testarum]|uniref:Uncharacterized protein n=1 Tax=Mastigocoleus testarum BC008 TaxID=371196 RepID=A0A0V7ZGG9_9CYAN|nr:hypothetical protein [Mastigocoleus testarum]KST63527.1 hypothetical protein BC008_13770 [Mastigocoleus testarum BC008]
MEINEKERRELFDLALEAEKGLEGLDEVFAEIDRILSSWESSLNSNKRDPKNKISSPIKYILGKTEDC